MKTLCDSVFNPVLPIHPTRRVESEVAVKLISVGGMKTRARVQLLSTNQMVTVRLPSQASARELGNHLYRNAVLSGTGEWVIDPRQFYRPTRLITFKVSSYRLLKPIAADELFERLSQAAGGVWDDTDPTSTEEESVPEKGAT